MKVYVVINNESGVIRGIYKTNKSAQEDARDCDDNCYWVEEYELEE